MDSENGLADESLTLEGRVAREGIRAATEIEPEIAEGHVVVSLATVMAGRKERVQWFWGGRDSGDGEQGLLPLDKVAFLGGYSGEGKSTLAFHLVSNALSTGRPLLGQPVTSFNRALILTETDEDQVRDIFTDATIQYPDRVRLIFSGLPFPALEREVEAFHPDILVVDSLTAFADELKAHGAHRFDWNGSADGTATVRAFRSLRRRFDIKLVLLLVHTNKPGKNEYGQRVMTAHPTIADIRGGGGIVEQSDLGFIMQPARNGKTGSLWNVKERKRGVIVEQTRFTFDSSTGLFEPLQNELTPELVVESVRDGHASRDAIARHLHFRRKAVGELIAEMLSAKTLVEKGSGKAVILELPR